MSSWDERQRQSYLTREINPRLSACVQILPVVSFFGPRSPLNQSCDKNHIERRRNEQPGDSERNPETDKMKRNALDSSTPIARRLFPVNRMDYLLKDLGPFGTLLDSAA